MNPQPEPRIGDKERAAAADALGEHYAAGRLTRQEYDERSERVWSAKTNLDLRPLFVDLPPLGGAHPNYGPPVQFGRSDLAWQTSGSRQSSPQRGRGPRGGGPARPRQGRGGVPTLPLVLLLIGLALLLDFGWWLVILAAVLLTKGLWHGCATRSPRTR